MKELLPELAHIGILVNSTDPLKRTMLLDAAESAVLVPMHTSY
ncbi:MAG TPA: hypothetical protein VLA89_13065 [Gemmatimonadales bacterium]|nr:hypothetical protein [Gemmatimonadales bacterium]